MSHALKKLLLSVTLCCACFIGAGNLAAAPATPPAEEPPAETETADPDADAPAAQEAEEGGSDITLFNLFQTGGWAMWPLLALSIAGVGLIIYNFIMLREQPFLQPEITEKLKEPLSRLDIEGARQICKGNPNVITNILEAGLVHVKEDHLDPDAVEKAMEAASTEELAGPFVLINYINVVASVAPMLGLLGTVSGMVGAFNTIREKGMGQPQLLAGDISEALITTATGLSIAVPALIFYFYFKNKYGRLTSGVTRTLGELYYTMMHAVHRN